MKPVLFIMLAFLLADIAVAQNVGIGVANPQAKLDVGGTLKITDGSQGVGKVLISDNNGMASWQPRKKPRVIRVVDANTGCIVIHTPIYNYNLVLTDTADYTITGKSIRLGTGRHDLNLYVDGLLVQVVITVTTTNDWADAAFTYGGTFLPGSHTITVSPADNTVAWGCGNLYGNMIITVFD